MYKKNNKFDARLAISYICYMTHLSLYLNRHLANLVKHWNLKTIIKFQDRAYICMLIASYIANIDVASYHLAHMDLSSVGQMGQWPLKLPPIQRSLQLVAFF